MVFKISKSWQVWDWFVKWLLVTIMIVLGFMDVRRSNVGLVCLIVTSQIVLYVSLVLCFSFPYTQFDAAGAGIGPLFQGTVKNILETIGHVITTLYYVVRFFFFYSHLAYFLNRLGGFWWKDIFLKQRTHCRRSRLATDALFRVNHCKVFLIAG